MKININLGSIMQKVSAYSSTTDGKARMQACIEDYRKRGVTQTGGGSRIISEDDMRMAAYKLIDVMRMTAQSHDLPASVMEHFDSLEASSVIDLRDGTRVIYIYFRDDLNRESLYSDGYDDGVKNIVALLNNGYQANDYVYGYWDGHKPTGESRFDGRSIDTDAYIRSRKDREGLQFIQQAIMDFNGNYGSEYNVTAYASDEYEA